MLRPYKGEQAERSLHVGITHGIEKHCAGCTA